MKGNYELEIVISETSGEKVIRPKSEYYKSQINATIITDLTQTEIELIKEDFIVAMKMCDLNG